MHLRNIAAAGALALGLSSAVAAQSAAVGVTPTRTADKDITLVGCVVKGDGGYVLSGHMDTVPDTGWPLFSGSFAEEAFASSSIWCW